jgi:hypothetical protein
MKSKQLALAIALAVGIVVVLGRQLYSNPRRDLDRLCTGAREYLLKPGQDPAVRQSEFAAYLDKHLRTKAVRSIVYALGSARPDLKYALIQRGAV